MIGVKDPGDFLSPTPCTKVSTREILKGDLKGPIPHPSSKSIVIGPSSRAAPCQIVIVATLISYVLAALRHLLGEDLKIVTDNG